MKSVFVGAGIMLFLCTPSYAQAPLRGKAVDECKSELGRGFKQPSLTACVDRKMDAARAAGKAKPKTGETCKYSVSGKKC